MYTPYGISKSQLDFINNALKLNNVFKKKDSYECSVSYSKNDVAILLNLQVTLTLYIWMQNMQQKCF